MTTRIVFVTSHPIQYQVPVFRHLANMKDVEFSVLFAMIPDAAEQGVGFGTQFEWDIPLLEGYDHKILENVSAKPSVTRFFGCNTPGILKELRAISPDAVIVNGWVVKTCLQALWASRRLGIPCLVRGEANDFRERAPWKKRLQAILVKQYDACLYIGAANKTFYLSRGVPQDRLFPSLYCVENERFKSATASLIADQKTIRERWGINPFHICFLYCGKFESKKHPLELLEAFRTACEKHQDLHLLMVGDGELKAECEAFVQTHQLPVSFAGFLNQTEIVQAYVVADCLVLPSDAGETWGLVVNEAMACGRPVLVSNLAGCAEDLIEPGVTGDVFRFDDWIALSEIMVRYGSDPSRLAAMGVSARDRIESYSPKAAAAGIFQAVENTVQRSRVARV